MLTEVRTLALLGSLVMPSGSAQLPEVRAVADKTATAESVNTREIELTYGQRQALLEHLDSGITALSNLRTAGDLPASQDDLLKELAAGIKEYSAEGPFDSTQMRKRLELAEFALQRLFAEGKSYVFVWEAIALKVRGADEETEIAKDMLRRANNLHDSSFQALSGLIDTKRELGLEKSEASAANLPAQIILDANKKRLLRPVMADGLEFVLTAPQGSTVADGCSKEEAVKFLETFSDKVNQLGPVSVSREEFQKALLLYQGGARLSTIVGESWEVMVRINPLLQQRQANESDRVAFDLPELTDREFARREKLLAQRSLDRFQGNVKQLLEDLK